MLTPVPARSRRALRPVALLLIAFGLGPPSRAGEGGVTIPRGIARHSVSSWKSGHGLPGDTVTAVVQTADGYLWAGTEAGLSRFDGLRFTNFRTTNTPALSSQSIRALAEDRHGNLWIGTDAGLVRHTQGRFEPAGLAPHQVLSIAEDREGILWIATSEGLFRGRNGEFAAAETGRAVPGAVPRSVFVDSGGGIWAAFSGRPTAFRVVDGRFQEFDAAGELRSELLGFAQTPDGAMWFGTADGLVRWHEGRASRIVSREGLAGGRISSLHVDGSGALWVAGAGLHRITGGEIAAVVAAAPAGATSVNSLCHDREGNIWMGTADEGLLRVRQPAWQLIGLNARGTATGFRTVMQAADGAVWLAQGNQGLVKVGVDGQVARLPLAPEDGEVLSAFVVPTGELFLGTRRALVIDRAGRREVHPELPEARAFFAASDGTLWIGVRDRGIFTYRGGQLAKVDLPGDASHCTVSSFTETPSGRILAGTWKHGLVMIDGAGAVVWDRTNGAPANDVRVVFADRGGAVWIGAPGLGLSLLEGDRLRTADWTSELFDERIHSISQDAAGNLWIASASGVDLADRDELLAALRERGDPKRLQIVRVTEGYRNTIDDLACFPNVCHTRSGLYWFATRDGILLGDAAKSAANPPPPPVHIERVMAGGRTLDAGKPVVLAAGTSGLLIEYSGISLTAPRRVRFQYRLKGIDPEWVDAGERRVASYASLPPGRHEFQVIASNADGVWNERGAVLAFVQQAHLHQRPWFLPLLAAASVAAAVALGRWRVATLRRDKRRLEQAIAERTGELRAAKELAEASTRAKSEFLQGVSHEIRNPLNGIIGLTRMLRDAAPAASQQELLVSLRACSKSLARVFEEVLNFTRLEQGQVAVHEAAFAVAGLAAEVAAMFRASDRAPGAAVRVEVEPGVPEQLVGDEEKIRTILGNFVANALRHAPGSPVTLTVSADSVNEYAAGVTFVVTDRGPGIPEEEQELIFGKFVRGTAARGQRVPGTGLGLATCRALAELLGGHVGVDSVPGQGASFFLTLRLQRAQPRALPDDGRADGTLPARRRALVVEDQSYNQIVIRRIAEELGFEADVASDAAGALAWLGRQRYDLILLDWELPDLDGERLARLIRADRGTDHTVIIATTAHDGDDVRRRCAEAGFDEFVLKPLDRATVARRLDDISRRRRGVAGRGARLDTRVFGLVGRARPEGARQAADDYVRILGAELERMQLELKRDDRRALAGTAHRLKAHAGLVRAVELRDAAARLERDARRAGPEELRRRVAEIAAAAAPVTGELRSPLPAGAAG